MKENMKLSSRIDMEVVSNENRYVFNMPLNAPAGEAYDAAFQVLEQILEMAKVTKDRMQKEEQKEEAAKAS